MDSPYCECFVVFTLVMTALYVYLLLLYNIFYIELYTCTCMEGSIHIIIVHTVIQCISKYKCLPDIIHVLYVIIIIV